MILTKRQENILGMVVGTHVKTAKPVGSESIAEGYGRELSSATIRNVMHHLEDLEYVAQPYPSAGRVPTDKGYRYYVDHLMSEPKVAPHVSTLVACEYRDPGDMIECLVERTSKILSELSVQAACVTFPNFQSLVLNRIELTKLGKQHLLVVWVAGNGFVENCGIEVKEEIPDAELNRVSQLLNSELSGMFLDQIRLHLNKKVEQVTERLQSLYRWARMIVDDAFPSFALRKLSLEGSHYVLEQPEFQNADTSHRLFQALEERQALVEWLQNTIEQHAVQVHIGSERRYEEMQDCSFVTAPYQIYNRTVGGLGVLGPKRMPYDRIVSLVDYVSRRFGEALERW